MYGNKKFTMDYDSSYDIMYVSIGKPKPSYCYEDIDGIVIRKSLTTKRLSGVTILDFSKKEKEFLEKAVPFKFDLEEAYKLISQ